MRDGSDPFTGSKHFLLFIFVSEQKTASMKQNALLAITDSYFLLLLWCFLLHTASSRQFSYPAPSWTVNSPRAVVGATLLAKTSSCYCGCFIWNCYHLGQQKHVFCRLIQAWDWNLTDCSAWEQPKDMPAVNPPKLKRGRAAREWVSVLTAAQFKKLF